MIWHDWRMSPSPPKFRQALAGLALVILALAGYTALAIRFGIDQKYPVIPIALALLGCFIAVRATRLAFSWPRLLVTLFALLLTALYSWWTLSFSNYEAKNRQLQVGQAAAGLASLSLKNHAGVEQTVLKPGMRTLLVFYRGFW
jgi:hypothetical protein